MKRSWSGGGLSRSWLLELLPASGEKGSRMLASRSRTSIGCHSMSACSKGTYRPLSRSRTPRDSAPDGPPPPSPPLPCCCGCGCGCCGCGGGCGGGRSEASLGAGCPL
eukprot:scaffold102750_cov75-Phaeocystis_antarctica.AAC.1